MEMNYNNIFQFPDRCILNKRLTKVFFTKNFDLTSSEKKSIEYIYYKNRVVGKYQTR